MGLFTHAPTGVSPLSHLNGGGGYRRRSAETWNRARDDYAGGLSAPEVCERHDLGLSALRKRAREDGWRRLDQPDPEPAELDEDDGTPPPAPGEMADLAYRRSARAAARGDVRAARSWMLLARDYRRLAETTAEVTAVVAAPAAEPAAQGHPQTERHPRTWCEGPSLHEANGTDPAHHSRPTLDIPSGPTMGPRTKSEGDVSLEGDRDPLSPAASARDTTAYPKVHEVHAIHADYPPGDPPPTLQAHRTRLLAAIAHRALLPPP